MPVQQYLAGLVAGVVAAVLVGAVAGVLSHVVFLIFAFPIVMGSITGQAFGSAEGLAADRVLRGLSTPQLRQFMALRKVLKKPWSWWPVLGFVTAALLGLGSYGAKMGVEYLTDGTKHPSAGLVDYFRAEANEGSQLWGIRLSRATDGAPIPIQGESAINLWLLEAGIASVAAAYRYTRARRPTLLEGLDAAQPARPSVTSSDPMERPVVDLMRELKQAADAAAARKRAEPPG